MTDKHPLVQAKEIENRIYNIRGVPVMIDNELAELYGVETRVLNQAVSRNIDRFPPSFRFQLSKEEIVNLISQNVISSSEHGGRRKLPYIFTEQGVAMLSAVLRSQTAVKVSIQIMQAFVQMRKFMTENAAIFQRLDKVERKQLETDEKFNKIFDALQSRQVLPKQGITRPLFDYRPKRTIPFRGFPERPR